MTSRDTTNTFSGHNNQGFQLQSNSGRVHVTFNIQPDTAQQERCLDKLSTATQAGFNSSERQHDDVCLPNTRIGVLNEIRAWFEGQDERRIYWLSGLAGTGKSTIARTIAREYFEHGCLGASFFFSKGGGDLGHARKFFTTIAFQLAKMLPSLKGYICAAISENDIENQSLRDQWHQLILQPLLKLDGNSSRSSYILVIDALDECEGESDIRAILQLLAEARSLKTVQLRVFLTSRPEIPIRHSFYQISNAEHQDFVLHNVQSPIIDNDIRIFLEYSFKLIGRERSLYAGWPGEQKTKRLIQKANGLFIWAATASRFVREGKLFADKRLNMILEDNVDSTTAPEKHLNEIYVTVLKQSVNSSFTDNERKHLYRMLRQILGSIVVLFSPFTTESLGKLLHITKEVVDQTLEDLHAILDIPEDQKRPLRLHHPSFRDFLINKARCEDSNFWIDEKQAHKRLADNCIRLMVDSLKQDICSLDTYGVLVTDIDRSRLQQCLPREVQYACLYWIQHLQKSRFRLYDEDQVHHFLQVHVLHWLEALSWMRKVSEGIRAITSLESIAFTSDCPRLYAFIHDIKRFVLYGRSAIDQAPLQVYYSAIIFAPMTSMVKKQFGNQMPCWIKKLPKVEKDWNIVLQTLEGHSKPVYAVAFSPDSKMLASASSDTMVKLWDAGTGAILQTLKGHSSGVKAVAFSPGGMVLASASDDTTVKLWDACTGAALQTLKGHSSCVNALSFSPDGIVLASASSDATVRLWDTGTGAALQTPKDHLGSVNTVTFSPDGKVLASASDGQRVGELASASDDWTVKLWDAGTGATLQTLKGHSSLIKALAFSPDGKVLASASDDETVKLWDVVTKTATQTLKSFWGTGSINTVAFSPNGKLLASASNDRLVSLVGSPSENWTVKLWKTSTGAALQTLKGHSAWVNSVAFSPDGKVLASASGDTTVKLWDVGTKAALQTPNDHSRWVQAVISQLWGANITETGLQMLKDEWSWVLAVASHLWDADLGAAVQTLHGHSSRVNGHSRPVRVVTFSPDGKVLASASNGATHELWDDATVKLWDTGTGAALQKLKGYREAPSVSVMAFSPDGKVLAVVAWGTVRLWDTSTGAALQTHGSIYGGILAVAFSPDGKVLAAALLDKIVELLDVSTGEVLQILKGHSKPIKAVAFSPDGKVLASASDDATIRLWDASTGAALQTLMSHSAPIRAVAFSRDSKLLASASDDQTVKLWSTETGAAPQTLKGHSDVVRTVAFSPDGKVLASASHDATVKLWDAGTGVTLQVLEVDAIIENMSFTNDGMFLETDRGRLRTKFCSPSEGLSQWNLSCEVFIKDQWITRGEENMIWLPSEYRPSCSSVRGSVVALGHASGRLSIMELAF